MIHSLISLRIDIGDHVVLARQKARELAAMLGFGGQDQIRIATAVSEIVRNVLRYAGKGRIDFELETRETQWLKVSVIDAGPGIRELEEILAGRYTSTTGMGLGLLGARRLMDECHIVSEPGRGTTVIMEKALPRTQPALSPEAIRGFAKTLFDSEPVSTFDEVQRQNRELIATMAALRDRQEELTQLTHELEDTNRGVVALLNELEEGADHLRRADTMKSRFLSNMSHEFRTPLSSVRALARLLRDEVDGPLSSEQHHQVDLISRSTDTLFDLVNDLLDLAKIEAGKVVVKSEPMAVAEMFSALRGMLRPLAVAPDVVLDFIDPPPVTLFTDEAKLSQILRNFISNALKYTEQGSVSVSCTLLEGERVEFAVADTGIGIAAEHHDLIFEEFAQVEHRLQRQVKGTGLGLPLCRKLAGLLGGLVAFSSTAGAGSRFTVTVPLNLAGQAEDTPATASTLLPVLLIDDDPAMHAILRGILKNTRFEALSVLSLAEADAFLLRRKPAVVVLDLLMPGEDAWSWLARHKASLARQRVPIVIVSNTGEQHRGLISGAGDVFQKPLDPGLFVDALGRLVDKALQ